MIDRYARPEMAGIWSEDAMYTAWLQVEVAVAEAWAHSGRVPAAALPAIRAAQVDAARVREIETVTRHDMNAFLQQLSESVGPDARWIHLGLTSSDVKDTGLALQLRASLTLIAADLSDLSDAVAALATRHRNTIMIGRTHNVHAEPITFGFKVLGWYEELQRHRRRLEDVRREVSVAKISGAVGAHANVPPWLEERVAAELALGVEPVSTQVVPRDRHAAYVLALAMLASTLDRMATELRSLQHTEIREVEEPFGRGQQGSSAMPHKRNPILNERISGLARVMRGYAVSALENVVLWHERDMSNSSEERIVLPGASILADFMVTQMTGIIRDMRVDERRMRENLDMTRGLIFSEKVLTALVDAGMSRQQAYAIVQRAAMRTWETSEPLLDVLRRDPEVTSILSHTDLARAFSLDPYLEHVGDAFGRAGLASEVHAADREPGDG